MSRFSFLAAALALCAACGSRQTQLESTGDVALPPTDRPVDAIVAAWPQKQRETANKLIAKYGQPDASDERALVWYNKGPYVKTVLSRDEQMHNFPMPHTDYLAQTVMYKVPADKLDDLAQYDGSVWFKRTRGELTAQCDLEEANNLALNLAVDIATGTRTVEDARDFYAKTIMEFKQGKTSDYVSGLRFQPQPNAGDPDKQHQM